MVNDNELSRWLLKVVLIWLFIGITVGAVLAKLSKL